MKYNIYLGHKFDENGDLVILQLNPKNRFEEMPGVKIDTHDAINLMADIMKHFLLKTWDCQCK